MCVCCCCSCGCVVWLSDRAFEMSEMGWASIWLDLAHFITAHYRMSFSLCAFSREYDAFDRAFSCFKCAKRFDTRTKTNMKTLQRLPMYSKNSATFFVNRQT